MTRPLAVITGASTGIGFELAHIAAQQGYDLIVAADEALIADAAADLRSHGGNVEPIEVDLSTFAGVDSLLAVTQGRPVEILCANAGVGFGGPFLEQDVSEWQHIIDTNVTGTVYLIQRVLADMVARDSGKMLVTGSIAGFLPGTFNAIYNATKAFVDNFTEALRNEIKDHRGVTVTTLMPGATETEFFARAGLLDTKMGASEKADPAKVARDGWNALMAGRGHIVSGFMNKAQAIAAGMAPQAALAELHRRQFEPGSAED